MAEPNDQERIRDNLQDEVDGAAVYEALADAEKDENLKRIYRRLASVERAHAEFWRSRLGRETPLSPSLRARVLSFLARRFGPSVVLPALASAEGEGSAHYDSQPDAVAGGLPKDERQHARIIRAAASSPRGLRGPQLARLEGHHRGGGNALRAAVLGANDGLVSNLSLVMAIAGAIADEGAILLTGIAGLIAGGFSMAMGEWLSVTSSRELYERQIETEARELKESPEAEMAELALIYQAKGLGEAEANALAQRLLRQKDAALDTLVREELGIDPAELGGSPWSAAGVSFLLFATGAIFPVLRARRDRRGNRVVYGTGIMFSALRQLAIGYAAALLTFAIGRIAGVALA